MTESIIIDNGTNTIKAGFSDDDMPRVVIPTVLGKPFSNTGGVQEEEEEDINEQIDITFFTLWDGMLSDSQQNNTQSKLE